MGNNYCTHCGKPLGYGDRYCSDCGSRTNVSDTTFSVFQPTGDTGKKCPRCNGTGKCRAIDNVPGAVIPLIAVVTAGIAPITMSIVNEKCQKCNGTGKIPF